jgi:hypothetical protein
MLGCMCFVGPKPPAGGKRLQRREDLCVPGGDEGVLRRGAARDMPNGVVRSGARVSERRRLDKQWWRERWTAAYRGVRRRRGLRRAGER